MNGRYLLLVAALLPAGCTHRMTVPVEPGAAGFREANRGLADRRVRVTFHDGHVESWENAHLGTDSVDGAFLFAHTRPLYRLNDIEQLEVRRGWKGALDGSLIGGAIGAVMAVASLVEGGPEADVSAALALYDGVFLGALIGGLRTHRTVIRMEPRIGPVSDARAAPRASR